MTTKTELSARILLEPTTLAGASSSFNATNNIQVINVPGLQGSETATLQKMDPITGTYINTKTVLTATTDWWINCFELVGTFRILKTATTNPISVSLEEKTNTSTIQLGGI